MLLRHRRLIAAPPFEGKKKKRQREREGEMDCPLLYPWQRPDTGSIEMEYRHGKGNKKGEATT
jgi:hypothetical protein